MFIKRAIVPIAVVEDEEVADWEKANEVVDTLDTIAHRRLATVKKSIKNSEPVVKPVTKIVPKTGTGIGSNSEK